MCCSAERVILRLSFDWLRAAHPVLMRGICVQAGPLTKTASGSLVRGVTVQSGAPGLLGHPVKVPDSLLAH